MIVAHDVSRYSDRGCLEEPTQKERRASMQKRAQVVKKGRHNRRSLHTLKLDAAACGSMLEANYLQLAAWLVFSQSPTILDASAHL